MDGLGYGLVEVGGVVNYNCNYKGFTFKYPAPLDEIAVVIDQVDQYESYDEEGNGIGKITVVDVPRNIMKDEKASAIKVKEHFDKDIAGSAELKEWFASINNIAIKDVSFHVDEEDIKTVYDKVDYTVKTDDGDTKSIIECLDKVVKTNVDGQLMVVK